MKLYSIRKILIVFLTTVIIVSCNKEKLSVSNSTNQTTNQTTNQQSFPPATGAARIFNFFGQSLYPVRDYTTRSRYVLYDTGAFWLQYFDNGGGTYSGGYTEVNGIVTFRWQGWSTAGPWGATGKLRGDTLSIEYNSIMEMSDFENAVYLRKP